MAWLALATLAGGCASTVADLPLVGVPTAAPARPDEPFVYPAVNDMPGARPVAPMVPAEQAKMQADLIAARKQAATAGGEARK